MLERLRAYRDVVLLVAGVVFILLGLREIVGAWVLLQMVLGG